MFRLLKLIRPYKLTVFKYDTEGIVKAFQANVRVVVAEESFDDWPSFPVANADRSKGNKQMSNHLTYL